MLFYLLFQAQNTWVFLLCSYCIPFDKSTIKGKSMALSSWRQLYLLQNGVNKYINNFRLFFLLNELTCFARIPDFPDFRSCNYFYHITYLEENNGLIDWLAFYDDASQIYHSYFIVYFSNSIHTNNRSFSY